MQHPRALLRRCGLAAALLCVMAALSAREAAAASPHLVISQIYVAGGASGSTYKCDYVELYNRGTVSVPVSTWSLQYATAGGAFKVGALLNGRVEPGRYHLVRGTCGPSGANLPAADSIGSFNLPADGGKVALVASRNTLPAGCPPAGVVDLAGYGAADCAEGGPAQFFFRDPVETHALFRQHGGEEDFDDNSWNFFSDVPLARNRSSIALIISEFRLSGPGGATDEFIEFYNTTDAPVIVSTQDGSAGWALAQEGVSLGGSVSTVFVIPNGTVIPARGHFLAANTGYSLSGYPAGAGTATPNLTYSTDIAYCCRGLALYRSATNLTFRTRLDAVGPRSQLNPNFREGLGYLPDQVSSPTAQHTFFRYLGATGLPKDTNENAADFVYADTTGGAPGLPRNLGAPGPENLASPVQRNEMPLYLFDLTAARHAPPNRVRSETPDPANNSAAGTILFRRRVINWTNRQVTRLRFRITSLTTHPVPAGVADLRARNSLTAMVLMSDPTQCANLPTCAVPVHGTTLETPPAQPLGGGFNSTLSVTLPTPLPAGHILNVQFLLGVQQPGRYSFLLNVEALP